MYGFILFAEERMKILITGGAGFICSHLVDKLVEKKYEVVIIDNLSTGKRRNINTKANFYEVDITDKSNMEKIFAKEKFDVVNHHAAQIDVRKSVKNPGMDARINIIGLLNLLELSVKYNIKKFVNISSGGVIYDQTGIIPYTETSKKKQISPYGISKFSGELYCEFFSEMYDLVCVSLRYSNVYENKQEIIFLFKIVLMLIFWYWNKIFLHKVSI